MGLLLVGSLQLGCSGDANDGAQPSVGLLSDAKTLATMDRDVTAAGLDCQAFVPYTAALATQTVDCLGTIRPDSYVVGPDNRLQRNFDSCPLDATQLASIDALLSLQRREAMLPNVKECIGGAYADYVRGFAARGVSVCPNWHKERTVNPITASVVDRVLPQLSAAFEPAARGDLQVPKELEVENLYRASYAAAGASDLEPGLAAKACAAGFAGFVLEAEGSEVLTDPPAWLLDVTYPGTDSNPYLRTGYCHPMSWYGGAPGAVFGHANRYRACDLCPPEFCSYYAGIHKQTRLQLDCLDDADWSTCVSYCGPPLP